MNLKIVSWVKSSPTILYLAAFVYSMLHNRYYLTFVLNKKVSCKGVFFKRCRIVPSGRDCHVTIEPLSQIQDSLITLVGDDTKLTIGGERTVIKNAQIHLLDKGSTISIGKSFTVEGGWIMSTEGNSITIGDDCMFSSDVEITNGDFHPIFSQSDRHQVVNYGKSVCIAEHVWLGSHVRVLKGTVIAPYCIVGNSSLVAGDLLESHSVYAGVPARLVRSEVDWSREHRLLLSSINCEE